MLKELLNSDSASVLENNPELRKELWKVISYKTGMDEKTLKEVCEDFDFRYNNYQKLYNAIKEQMQVMEQIRNKKE